MDSSSPHRRELPEIQAVLFDCDGVLVDTEPLGREILVRQLRQRMEEWPPGAERTDEELRSLWPLGAPLGPSLLCTFGDRPSWALALEREIRGEMDAALSQRSYALPGMPGVFEALCRARTCVVGICSNGPLAKMRRSLQPLDFPSLRWEHVFSGHERNAFKPDPTLLLWAAESLGVHPAQTLLIDDSAAGLLAAASAGMNSCHFGDFAHFGPGARTNSSPFSEPAPPSPTFRAADAGRLRTLLEDLGLLTPPTNEA